MQRGRRFASRDLLSSLREGDAPVITKPLSIYSYPTLLVYSYAGSVQLLQVTLSKIFEWYGSDFGASANDQLSWIAKYLVRSGAAA